jgi:CBS domain-containing protein
MRKNKVKRLPVVDADGRLAGIISRADVLAVFDRSDTEICAEITGDVILGQFLVDPNAITVTVKDGVVTLAGVPESQGVGQAIVDQVRHIPGVVAVRDRLRYPSPASGLGVLTNYPVD